MAGELPQDARAPVAEHVAACEICAEEVRGLRRVMARAADLPKSIEPPAEAWENIKTAILKDEAAVATQPRSRSTVWRHPVMMAVAASIVVAVLSSDVRVVFII